MPYVQGVDRNQTTLFPESIEDYITGDNPVRVIDVYVEQLDMGVLKFNFATAPSVGRPPYDPRIMLKLGDETYYAQCFHYEREEDVYICPEGSALSRARARKNKDGILIG